jgi:hypothetical protein
MDVTANRRLSLALRIAAGVAASLAAAAHGLLWLFISAWRCDESCDYPDAAGHYPADSTWHQIPGAWQWSALGWMGVAGFALAVAFAVALAWRKGTPTLVLGGAAAVTALLPWLFDSLA